MRRLRAVERKDRDAIEKTYFDGNGELVIEEIRSLDNLFNENKRLEEFAKGKNTYLVARLTPELLNLWKQQGFDWFKASDSEKRAKLNDPDNEMFRVFKGKV